MSTISPFQVSESLVKCLSSDSAPVSQVACHGILHARSHELDARNVVCVFTKLGLFMMCGI